MRLFSTPNILNHLTNAAHWGVLADPKNSPARAALRGCAWALDNGAFKGFRARPYIRMLLRYRHIPGCWFVTVPDVVGDAHATLALFPVWSGIVGRLGYPVAFVAQDGQEDLPLPDGYDWLFIGGSTAWKLSAAAHSVVRRAKADGKRVHMGRVNSIRRYRYAEAIGCNSCDGTGWGKFMDQLRLAERHVGTKQHSFMEAIG